MGGWGREKSEVPGLNRKKKNHRKEETKHKNKTKKGVRGALHVSFVTEIQKKKKKKKKKKKRSARPPFSPPVLPDVVAAVFPTRLQLLGVLVGGGVRQERETRAQSSRQPGAGHRTAGHRTAGLGSGLQFHSTQIKTHKFFF